MALAHGPACHVQIDIWDTDVYIYKSIKKMQPPTSSAIWIGMVPSMQKWWSCHSETHQLKGQLKPNTVSNPWRYEPETRTSATEKPLELQPVHALPSMLDVRKIREQTK